MPISTKFKQQLKAKAHSLRPVVLLGVNGLTDTVNQEIDRALHDHELIKIRVGTDDRQLRLALLKEICEKNKAELVQKVGKIGVLYRKNKDID